MVVYALWNLQTEELIGETEDPQQVLDAIDAYRTAASAERLPVFGLTEYHPALQTHSSITGEESIETHLHKRIEARRRRQS